MLTFYTFLPLVGASFAALIIAADFDWVPLWFKASALPISVSIEMAIFTLALLWVFYRYEKYIFFDSIGRKKILFRAVATTVVSVLFLLASNLVGFETNIRELSQEFSLNVPYNILRVLILFFYFGLIGKTKPGAIIFCIVIGYFNAFSGSKASMLIPILIAITVLGRLSLKTWCILVAGVAASIVGLIPGSYFGRYFDPALSAYQTAFIYYDSGLTLVDYYIQLIVNSLLGIKGFNPVMEYLNDSSIAGGYNLTPTIVGEMMGSGTFFGLLIFLFINLYLWTIKRLWLCRGPIGMKYFTLALFVMAGTLQSSLLDVVFYIPYFFIALGFVKVVNFSLGLRKATSRRV